MQDGNIQVPVWLATITGSAFGLLILLLAWFSKKLVSDLTDALKELAKAFNNFKDEAPSKFVTTSFFGLARQQIEDGITGANRRIDDFAKRFEKDLEEHKSDCPARSAKAKA